MKHLILSVFGVLLFLAAQATHNRAGQITYRHVGGNVYEITVITYTRESVDADRPILPIDWGDGSGLDSLYRDPDIEYLPNDVQKNTYVKSHAYPGAGSYIICVNDPNRNQGIVNISNSVEVIFGLQTTIKISSLFAPNNSVAFDRIPIQDACRFQPWIHNPGAFDIDNDSLSFELVFSMGENCEPLPNTIYRFPDEVGSGANNNFSINPVTGTITWDAPQIVGEYNIAFAVHEWRDGAIISSVIRDMQVTVDDCDNIIPEITEMPDTCVEAGQTLEFVVAADDPNDLQVEITGYAGAFAVENSPATLSQSNMQVPTGANFEWNTLCGHVRLAPYQTIFEATDNNPSPLSNIMEMNILVVAPAPENLTAESVGSTINLNWEQSICGNAVGYKVYRRIDPFGYEPSHCETGVPEYTGYVEIASLEGLDNTSYTDEDEIIFGRQTCYMVIAYFQDGAESYASNEACAEIRFEIPIIIKNSVGSTGEAGRDSLVWRNPILLDQQVFPPPYQYRVFRIEGFGVPDELVFETEENANIFALDTAFVTEPLNTADTAHTYRVELYSQGVFAAQSNRASSVFLSIEPNDNRMDLSWEAQVPWMNFEYDIYKLNDNTGAFEFLASTADMVYSDTGLVNNTEYCYYIVSRGSYFAIEENDTLLNYSQQVCSRPYDKTPPCPPVLSLIDNCVDFTIDIAWNDPNADCEDTDDVTQFNLYFKPTPEAEYELLETFDQSEIREYFLTFDNSIAGCYAMSALDSLAPWPDGELHQNESILSEDICVDNCPEYELPNVFTPNGDGKNDVFRPYRNRSNDSVEFTVFNRWGSIVYQSTDPELKWDGYSQQTGEIVSDGTYYYTCIVNSIRLSGIEPINLAGYVTVFSGRSNIQD